VRATEGEIKAHVAQALSGVRTVSFPGAGAIRLLPAALKTIDAERLLLAFDADAREKRDVAHALRRAVPLLSDEGFAVELEIWDVGPDGAPKGIDDLLLTGRQPDTVRGTVLRAVVADIVAEAERRDPLPVAPLGADGAATNGNGAHTNGKHSANGHEHPRETAAAPR
jgi:hypothetical protein